MIRLVLLRHGESTWNLEKIFTGWTDVPLTPKGRKEAREAGRMLKEKGYSFDLCFTSVLKRATDTLRLALEEMGIKPEIMQSWRLNEKHYGALQGKSKPGMMKEVGEEQVQKWRRSYRERPPSLKKNDPRHPVNDPLYKDVKKSDLPSTESLEDCVKRTLPYWHEEIEPALKKGKKVMVCAHGNSIRGIVMHLDKLSGDEVAVLEIPIGIPLVYELDDNLKPVKKYYLGDQKEIDKRLKKVNIIRPEGS